MYIYIYIYSLLAIRHWPEQKHRKQFQALAISGVHPSIMCNVHLCEDGRKLVDQQLIKLSRRISSIALSSFLTGGKNLPTVKLDLKGKTFLLASPLHPAVELDHRAETSRRLTAKCFLAVNFQYTPAAPCQVATILL